MELDDFERWIMVDVCKDGTISYRRRGQAPFNGVALPVFSVNTEAEAQSIQTRFGVKQYNSHPLMPDRDWYRMPDFGGDVEELQAVTEKFREFWLATKPPYYPMCEKCGWKRGPGEDSWDGKGCACTAPRQRKRR